MTLDTYAAPERLYLARGDEVNPNRPMFTGDVYANVNIPGLEDWIDTLTDAGWTKTIAEARFETRCCGAGVTTFATDRPNGPSVTWTTTEPGPVT